MPAPTTLISNRLLPGYAAQRTLALGNELQRLDITDPTGAYVGQVVHVRRRLGAGGSQYGWRPAQAHPNTKLTTKVDAVRRLPRYSPAGDQR